MPRGQATAKRQQGVANQRDTRHENGLVGPGKRVQRQKSNGHLNGHAKQPENNSKSPTPTPPLPSLPSNASSPYPQTNGHARQTQPHPADAHSAADPKMSNGNGNVRRPSAGAYSESSSSESYHNVPGISNEYHRRIDVNAAKNPAVHRDVGPLNLALTVLRSCPLYDTIAILIVLLQLPPTFLSLIHLLFATLTFVPPSSSTATGLSFTDIFEGTMGTPSVATILVVDLFVLMIWLFLWNPAQDIALDLAQTVIAFTLGGGTNGRDAGLKNIFICFSIVGMSHFTRNGDMKQSGLRALLSSSNRILGSPDPDDPLEQTAHSVNKKGAHGWIRSILAIHILAQGLVRYVRDWYVRRNLREKRDTSTSINDPEAGKALADPGNDFSVPASQSQDNDPTTPLPVTNTVSSKKKKKQSAQVRIRQPLWAALASTKIVVVKEYETSHTAAESAGTNATDINNLGNAPFNTEADRIWITYVGTDEVLFSTSYFPNYTPSESCEEKNVDSSGVDKSKPFYVRVNQTIWQPTRINAAIDPERPARQDSRWSGEVFGLAPASNYECEFVSTADHTVIFSTNVRTLQAPTADTAVGLSPNPQVSGRPGSPTTTLKTSIASSEVKLTEERHRQKRERKDQRAKLHSIRKEIDKLANSIASSGGNDDRVRQKIQQNHLHTKQAEDALISLAEEIKSLETVPKDDASLYASSKSEFQTQKEQHKQSRSEFNNTKQAAERDISTLNNEISTLQQKRERMQSRIAKLNGEHERITDANAKGLDEVQRKERERQAKDTERAKIDIIYNDRLAVLNAQVLETTAALQVMYRNIDTMQQAEIYAAASPTTSVPNLHASSAFGPDVIPEGLASAAYPWNPAMPATTGGYVPSIYSTQLPTQPQGYRTRGRSSSMLSNLSGFTQSDGDAPGPSYPPQIGKAVWYDADKERNGSSGSGSGPGSVGDPKSPIVGNGHVAK
ncbi:Uncharacterized protein BP5553_01094 [Venustampulla echinocandica]|uniref:Ubiquitination network signaling protein acrB n=1 Tax=Venustampulla echinocandica TaxID=2656787 RepID=A0A370U026_9HELO|nr:Uncharacterized protein BP5553_01094 [Venustampulla echinocandica]RDL41115.1 Uncharacterized protein BP5553_01094 [Venustampulla echinocandica]